MTNKIIGFTVSKTKIDHGDIDVFRQGLTLYELEINGLNVYLWGIHQVEKCKINGKFSLSFPLSENLLDRNVLLYPENGDIIIENDWLGSIPIFYNEKEGIVSTLSLKTLTNSEIHPEGLANFVECGFSVLGQTPFSDIKIMRYYSKLIANSKGITIKEKNDPILWNDFLFPTSDETDVFKLILQYINNVEVKTKDEIIIPTSGGFDSRLLNLCVQDKSRIRAFTYGLSDNQSESFEVIYGKKIAEILGVRWEQVELGRFHDYISEWFRIYGISTHLHGMYQIEFYKKILQDHEFGNGKTLLSGIFGDVWAGNVSIPDIKGIKDFPNLVYSHGMIADKNKILKIPEFENRKDFLFKNHAILKNNAVKIVFLIRIKLILISYLMIIPEYYGIPAWSPFLNFNIVSSILCISEDRRKDRIWQKDLFNKFGVDVESQNLPKDIRNTLNQQAFVVYDFTPLDVGLLQGYFKKEYLEKINSFILKGQPDLFIKKKFSSLLRNRYSRYLFHHLGVREKDPLSLLYAYYVLKSIEMGLIRGAKNDSL